jgi:hypothetical protein
MGRPRVRLAARDCAGDAVVEPALEVAPEATREAVFFETVLWLSRARLRRSRIAVRVAALYGARERFCGGFRSPLGCSVRRQSR